MLPKAKGLSPDFLFLFSALVIFMSCFFLFFKLLPAIADEPCHSRMILGILDGTDRFPKLCPYLPGYHWTVALLYWLTHFRGPGSTELLPLASPVALYFFPTMLRLLSTILSFASFVVYFFLVKTLDRNSTAAKATFFLFSPLFVPYFFLIYTDIYSLMYLFLALLFAIKRRLWLSGFFGILSLMIRQNNIFWLGFIVALVYIEDYYPQYKWKDVRQWISKFFFFFFALFLVAVFVIWNKGFILGDKAHHPLGFSLDNFFLLLFLFFFLFLPQNLFNAPKILALLKRNRWIIPILIVTFLLYLFCFKANHLYNTVQSWFQRFLHNWLLEWMRNPALWSKMLTFLPIGYSLLSLCVTRLERRSFYLLYPFTFLFLSPIVVIEPRYLFIPIAFFILFMEPPSEEITLATLATNLTLTGCLIAALSTPMALRFFP
ncbi:MAG TPA: hypothetical protein PLO78_04785 [Candidatus Omnitrophota bacterium]|nr:hypothetical protein [Candidatus Omnitrophota bacterium]